MSDVWIDDGAWSSTISTSDEGETASTDAGESKLDSSEVEGGGRCLRTSGIKCHIRKREGKMINLLLPSTREDQYPRGTTSPGSTYETSYV